MIEAFGIFEGGGAKGLAHIGALHTVTEKRDIEFIGVAGTSAGAIVASLIAANYKPDELFNSTYNTGILKDNFIKHFGRIIPIHLSLCVK